MKYEFTGKTKTVLGVNLRQIRALVKIVGVVSAGDVGGWIESEKNLSQVSGDAWVYGDARVYGNARVFGDAWVYGDSRVFGDAWVCGDAQVYGNELIFWASKVGTENGTITVYNSKDNSLLVTRGCFIGTTEQFLTASKKKHDARTQHEYKLLIEVAASRIEAARAITKQLEEASK